MKKMLYIAGIDPLPPDDGGKAGVFYPVKMFASKFKTYFLFYTQDTEENAINKYAEYNIVAVPIKKICKNDYSRYLFSLFSEIPFYFQKYQSDLLTQKTLNLIEKEKIDAIFISGTQNANLVTLLKNKYPKLKIYLREHNIEYDLVKQYAETKTNLIMKFFSYIEYFKTKHFVLKYWKYFDKVYFVSKSDLINAQRVYSSFDDSNLLYSGIDAEPLTQNNYVEENSFIFTGSLRGFQNYNNLKHFIRNIWIPFHQKFTTSKLYITGNKVEYLKKRLKITEKNMSELNIINLGYVEDVKKEILTKQFFISPTIYGSGFRMKVLDALALRKIVFVTDIDYQMADCFKDMENIVHYSDKDDFIKKYLKIKNENLYTNIANNGYCLIDKYFNWQKFAEIVEKDILGNCNEK